MRLLFVSLNYAPELTATGKYTGELAEWFASRGHAVDVIAGLPHYPEWSIRHDYRSGGTCFEQLNGVKVYRCRHYVPASDRVTVLRRLLMEWTFSLSSVRWWVGILLRRSKYDFVIAVCPPLVTAVFPVVYRLLRRVPWAVHVQDLQVDAAMHLGLLKLGPASRLLYGVEAFLLRRANHVSTISPQMLERIVRKGVRPDRAAIVPNWANLREIVPGPTQNTLRAEMGIGADKVLVMYAGAIGRKQGLELVLELARRLKNEPRFRVVIAGDGAERVRLVSRAEELGLANLTFLPVQPMARLSELLAAGDIHLVIQSREAADLVLPSKLTNILAAGRPAIATVEMGTALWDVLNRSQSGWCTHPGDVEQLAEAVLRMGADAEGRRRMGSNARAYAEEFFNQDKTLGAMEAWLSASIAASQGPQGA